MKKEKLFIRPMLKCEISECVKMTLANFGTEEYTAEQFYSITSEFKDAFRKGWWGLPKYFVCEIKNEIVGMAGYSQSAMDWDAYEFFWLSVDKKHQGKGIAKALVDFRLKEIRRQAKFKEDITIMFSCTKKVAPYHLRNGFKILIEKAAGKEVIMGRSFLKK